MPAKRDEAVTGLVDSVVDHVKSTVTAATLSTTSEPTDGTSLPDVAAFIRQYYRRIPYDDLGRRSVEDLAGAALSHLRLARQRPAGTANVRVYNPDREEDGWQSTGTVVEIVTDDMPFLVDSVTMELDRHDLTASLLIHPVMVVRRDDAGRLTEILPSSSVAEDGSTEAVMHVEVHRVARPELHAQLRDDLLHVLADVRATVQDWAAMRDGALDAADELTRAGRAADPAELAEAADFLRWLAADNFTFIGSRDYALTDEGDDHVLRPVDGGGLGILREPAAGVSTSFAKLPPEIRRQARRGGPVLTLTKAQSRSTVHRAIHLDYVGVKQYDAAGDVVGERRILGLYTADANRTRPREIPLLRRKVQEVVKRAGFAPHSHDFKAFVEIIENFPRDELLQISSDALFETATGIMALEERPRVRLFVRRDPFGRYVSCLVYVPRDRYTTAVRERITTLLERALGGISSEFTVRVTESPLSRLHVLVYTAPDTTADADLDDLEVRLAATTRSWVDDLRDAAAEQHGAERGGALWHRYAAAFPAAYVEDFPATVGATDMARLADLDPAGDIAMSLYERADGSKGLLGFKLYRSGAAITLSDVLPVLENMGVRVVDERPYVFDLAADGTPLWVYDFGLTYRGSGELAAADVRGSFSEAFAAAWRGEAENDGFNRLVLLAELSWREVAVLRAFAKYLRQAGTAFSESYMIDALATNPHVAALLVRLFHARLRPGPGQPDQETADRLARDIEQALDAVASLDEDRILRNFLMVTRAVLRTNYYQPAQSAHSPTPTPTSTSTSTSMKPYLSFKLDPSRVPDLPLPHPLFEIWVYSPRMEGVHLRGGRVARGGIRWSDRREDFRTEILGLMKAQTVKNAVIVPVGAKGGFVVKQLPPGGDRDAVTAEVVACYRTLIRGLLDITDNLVTKDGTTVVVPAPDVVRHDGDDTYLVVAADKGTATFSDIANELSADYGFWLGDAFASGGSVGYDHKAMGITARGGWESVKRHFRELGHDTQSSDFTVVGIGDMSGDVFGNGMLLSRHIRLVAAFDHRHVFLDPDPVAATSYDERGRLFVLPRSSWDDYDRELISAGGGVFPRTAKRIPVSTQVRRALGLPDSVGDSLPPMEFIQAILRAPVDLLWNGGIGTYVKSSEETNLDVGDRTNDPLRVNADELRCRVVGEGGNLGFTQRGRIELALHGGRINTDAIDNSAGVDTSDHEVNIKALLDEAVRAGELTTEERSALLVETTDEVGELVLADNYDQTRALSNAAAQDVAMLGVHRRYIRALEESGRLNRSLEFLPGDEALEERGRNGVGLQHPELAVLLAYSKISLYDALLESDAPEDPYLRTELVRYFPHPLRQRFAEAMRRHPLRREIIATCLTNRLVNAAGSTFVFRMQEETGATSADIARAWATAREAFDIPSVWSALDDLDLRVPADVQTRMFLETRKLTERVTRWLLRNRRSTLDIAATASYFAAGVATLTARLPDLLPDGDIAVVRATADRLGAAGVPKPLATWVATYDFLDAAPDIVEVATETGGSVEDVARVYFGLDELLDLDWIYREVTALSREGRWQTLARAAVRGDLFAAHAALVRDVLRTVPSSLPAPEKVAAWAESNRQTLGRVTALLRDIRDSGSSDLATLSVALRELRSILPATPQPGAAAGA